MLKSPASSVSRSGGGAVLRWLLPTAAILIYTLLVYAPALGGTFLRGDDLIHLAIAYQYGPFTGFGGRNFDALPISASYYRPLFTLHMAALYRLFGVQYAGYQATAMFAHAVAAVSLFVVLRRLSGELLAALLGALFFVSHPYASPLVTWVSDTGVYTVLIAGLISLLLLDPHDRPRWYITLAALLILAPLTRENGVAICAAVFVYAIVAILFERISTGQAARIASLAVGSILVYALLRLLAMGALVRSVRPETAGLGFTLISAADVQAFPPARRMALYAYTVPANLSATFLPIFTPEGALSREALSRSLIFASLGVASGMTILTWQRWPLALRRGAVVAAALFFLPLGLLFFSPSLSLPPSAQRILQTSGLFANLDDIATVIGTLGIVYAAAHSGEWPREHRVMALYALALIAAISAVAFAYFRWRNLNLALMGWLILFALAAGYLRGRTEGRVLRVGMLAAMALAIILNSRDLFHELPPPDVRPETVMESQLCNNKSIPEPIIMEVTTTYGFDPEAIRACRAQP